MIKGKRLHNEYMKYMRRWKKCGKPIHVLETPCCVEKLEVPAPSSAQQWDSLVECPFCGQMFMKIVTQDRAVGKTLELQP